jgi:hypothetical protein
MVSVEFADLISNTFATIGRTTIRAVAAFSVALRTAKR